MHTYTRYTSGHFEGKRVGIGNGVPIANKKLSCRRDCAIAA